MPLKPFFCYYGGKWRAALNYPAPIHDTIIESFAGAAGYATRYFDKRVVLVERDPAIASLWHYLINVKAAEIRGLPDVPPGSSTDDLNVCAEARALIGFWLNKGSSQPKKRPSTWASGGTRPNSYWGPAVRSILASQVEAIRHWQIIEGSYEQAPDMLATWFIDPPYVTAGKHYRHRTIDYDALATWCQNRKGQIIVCEQEGATWLPFEVLGSIRATPGIQKKALRSSEVIWTYVNDE